MKLSNDGLNLLKTLEGCKLSSYKDVVGVNTIGFGSTKNVKPGMVITQEQANQRLREDLQQFETALNKLVKAPLNQNQIDSLLLLSFNIGITAFTNSTLLKLLNQGKYKESAEQFERWCKDNNGKIVPGLLKRRKVEKILFLS